MLDSVLPFAFHPGPREHYWSIEQGLDFHVHVLRFESLPCQSLASTCFLQPSDPLFEIKYSLPNATHPLVSVLNSFSDHFVMLQFQYFSMRCTRPDIADRTINARSDDRASPDSSSLLDTSSADIITHQPSHIVFRRFLPSTCPSGPRG